MESKTVKASQKEYFKNYQKKRYQSLKEVNADKYQEIKVRNKTNYYKRLGFSSEEEYMETKKIERANRKAQKEINELIKKNPAMAQELISKLTSKLN